MGCPFCQVEPSQMCNENEYAIAIRDSYPLSPGHTLVIPRQHVLRLYDLPENTQAAIWRLVAAVRQQLIGQFHPDGFNIGVNDGPAAGQTVGHLHIHLIPRYAGDREDPRGGVRWIIPERAKYWG